MSIEETYAHIVNCFDVLQQALLKLDKLPLPVVSVKCTSAYYRRTKALPATNIRVVFTNHDIVERSIARVSDEHLPPFLPALKVFITLQKSSRWGNNLAVIAKLKSAFYIDLSRRLRLEHRFITVPTEFELYVVVNRIVFSIRIFHHMEISSFREKSNESNTDMQKSSFNLKRDLIHKPMTAFQIHGLALQNAAFAESCVYAKMWLDANFLGKMFDGLAVELMVAYVFLHDKAPPRSGVAGFCRFVSLLATFDFAAKPLIVDVNSRFSTIAITEAIQNFASRRVMLPPIVIITPEDREGIMFTARKPEPVVFLRAVQFARHMNERISALTLENRTYSELELPTHDPNVYDILIHIGCSALPLKSRKEMKKTFNVVRPSKPYFPVVDFDPVKSLVKELRQQFHEQALFFFNPRRPSTIGIALRPTFLGSKDVESSFNDKGNVLRCPVDGELKANVEAFVEDLQLMGGKIARYVEITPRLCEKLSMSLLANTE